ncbi:MAG: exosortase/archaeosortase family protein [Bacteroidia bacterium]|jgi:exosortase/archaeosortase family protein
MLKKIKEILSNPINTFLLKGFLVLGIWTLFTDHLEKQEWFRPYWYSFLGIILKVLTFFAPIFLRWVGYEVINDGPLIKIVGTPGVLVGPACIGLGVLYGFVALMFVYPGPLKKKLWFTPIGIFGILIINSIRISSLAITSSINPDSVDFMHKYVFNVLAYIFIFIMWVLWVGYIGKEEKQKLKL